MGFIQRLSPALTDNLVKNICVAAVESSSILHRLNLIGIKGHVVILCRVEDPVISLLFYLSVKGGYGFVTVLHGVSVGIAFIQPMPRH